MPILHHLAFQRPARSCLQSCNNWSQSHRLPVWTPSNQQTKHSTHGMFGLDSWQPLCPVLPSRMFVTLKLALPAGWQPSSGPPAEPCSKPGKRTTHAHAIFLVRQGWARQQSTVSSAPKPVCQQESPAFKGKLAACNPSAAGLPQHFWPGYMLQTSTTSGHSAAWSILTHDMPASQRTWFKSSAYGLHLQKYC